MATLVDRAGPAHLEASLQHAIAIGDDTDTTAAIAGALVGARWGASAVPLRHQTIVHGLIPGRPGTRMDAADLLRLAVHTATSGRNDGAGWPGVDDLLPHHNPNLDAVLADTVDLVDGWLTGGRTVFLHCVAGHSRTPTVAALVLARRQGIPALDALARLRAQLPNLAPNPTFLQLLDG